jgi:hypothetical protein
VGGREELWSGNAGLILTSAFAMTVLWSVPNNVVTYSIAIVTNVEGWSVGSFDGVHGILWSRSNWIVRMMRIRMHRDAIRKVILRPVFGLPAIMVS